MKVTIIIVVIIVALIVLGWLGLQINPRPFPAFSQQPSRPETIPLSADLPAPVARFYRQLYGENVPVIESAVMTGRATMRINGLTFPARFRIIHQAGQGYRHYIEATFLGLPVMKVNEYYLDGNSRMELPFGVTEGEPKVDQGANLALWAESVVWLPAILLTDSRAQWLPVDDATALLRVPFGKTEEFFVVRFDPASGLPQLMETMRYKNPDSPDKILWLNQIRRWDALNGQTIAAVAALTWLDEGTPWAVFTVEEVIYNVAVEQHIRARGL